MLSQLIKSKKGQLGTLQSLTIGLVVVALVLVVGFQILAGVNANLTPLSTEANATSTIISAIDTNIVGNIGLIALIAVMSVVLFLVAGFASRR
jgi:archaellum biogenesis protein FlaJ (TadC family)|tara:strand:- start:7 stop:285 length:279 start_codon:yes stop_codon:yes gene_type:complete